MERYSCIGNLDPIRECIKFTDFNDSSVFLYRFGSFFRVAQLKKIGNYNLPVHYEEFRNALDAEKYYDNLCSEEDFVENKIDYMYD